MKEDFEGIEATLYEEIKRAYRAGWDPETAASDAEATLALFKTIPLKDHMDFFTKATHPVPWEKKIFITPLEHLIFAAVGFNNYTYRGLTCDFNPQPLLYVLEQVSFEAEKLKPITESLKTALELACSARHTHTFHHLANKERIEAFEKIHTKLKEIYKQVTGIEFQPLTEPLTEPSTSLLWQAATSVTAFFSTLSGSKAKESPANKQRL